MMGLPASLGLASLLIAAAAAATPEAERQIPAGFAELRAKDARVARIGFELATGNAAYCDRRLPATGLLLHDVALYDEPERLRALLGLQGEVAVQTVVPDSPAQRAGLIADQTVTEIAGAEVAMIPVPRKARWQRLLSLAEKMESALRADGKVALTLAGGERLTLVGVPACASRFEVGPLGRRAVADGTRVVIGDDFPGHAWSDELLAAVMAHELAHNILQHRAWLDARGRKRKDIRLTEREADRLAPWLLANAGYQPAASLRFMQTWGPDYSGGIFRKRTHDGWDERADAIAAEVPLVEAQMAATGRADWRIHFRREITP